MFEKIKMPGPVILFSFFLRIFCIKFPKGCCGIVIQNKHMKKEVLGFWDPWVDVNSKNNCWKRHRYIIIKGLTSVVFVSIIGRPIFFLIIINVLSRKQINQAEMILLWIFSLEIYFKNRATPQRSYIGNLQSVYCDLWFLEISTTTTWTQPFRHDIVL